MNYEPHQILETRFGAGVVTEVAPSFCSEAGRVTLLLIKSGREIHLLPPERSFSGKWERYVY